MQSGLNRMNICSMTYGFLPSETADFSPFLLRRLGHTRGVSCPPKPSPPRKRDHRMINPVDQRGEGNKGAPTLHPSPRQGHLPRRFLIAPSTKRMLLFLAGAYEREAAGQRSSKADSAAAVDAAAAALF